MASVNPGDEVILPAPYWTSYADMVLIAGGVPVVVPCTEANGFRITPEQLEAAITPRTRWCSSIALQPQRRGLQRRATAPVLEVVERHPQVAAGGRHLRTHPVRRPCVCHACSRAAVTARPHADGERCLKPMP